MFAKGTTSMPKVRGSSPGRDAAEVGFGRAGVGFATFRKAVAGFALVEGLQWDSHSK